MGDIFQSSVSGLIAFQKALATTSHNISNVNTDGYSRQRVELGTRAATPSGSGFTGNGVESKSVRRIFDQARQTAVEQNTSEYKRLNTFADYAGRIDNLLADQSAGISPALQDFFGAIQDVSNDPSSSTARQTVLTQGQNLVSRFQFVDGRLRSIGDDVNQQLKVNVNEINGYAENIAKLNEQIVAARGRTGGQPPNDLLDQRDALITSLSEKIGTKVVAQNNGALNVSIGNGQALVAGFTANKLQILSNSDDPQVLGIGVGAGGTPARDISSLLKGGQLGGLLDFRNEVLNPAKDDLGRLATSISVSVNKQHHLGMQFDSGKAGQLGGDFFSVGKPDIVSSDGKGGLSASIDTGSVGDLTGANYRVAYDNGSGKWKVTRLTDGTSQNVADGPFDGIDFSVAASTDKTRSFKVRPTRNAVADMAVELSRPGQVAVASPLVAGEKVDAQGQSANAGTAALTDLSVSDTSGLPLTSGPIELQFDATNNQFVVSDKNGSLGAINYTSSDYGGRTYTPSFMPGGAKFTISGQPADGDTFTISRNSNGLGDNTNGLALGQLSEKAILDKGNSTIQEAYSGFVGDVGTQTLRANVNRDAQESLLNQAKSAREDVSGVNLNEEAANLLKFQRAYQASAHAISTANTLFDSLLNATR